MSALWLNSETGAGSIIWGNPSWFMPAAALVAVVAATVVWSYFVRPVPLWVRSLGITLKITAALLLAMCLLQPMRSGTRPEPMSNLVAMVADTSASMGVAMKPGGESRSARLERLLHEERGWRDSLAELFQMRLYGFGSRLDTLADGEPIGSDAESSSLATSLGTLSQRLSGRPVAAVMLFSDGNATDLVDNPADWSRLSFPVFPVVPANESTLPDLSIQQISVSQTDFESAPVTINAAIEGSSMESRQATVDLREFPGNRLIEQKSITLPRDGTAARVRFQFRPEAGGVGFYQLSVTDEADRQNEGPSRVEATRVNNDRLVAIERKRGPYRILYVAGRPNWEYKFIRRALDADEEVQLVGLLRIANKQPKFSFRDQGVTSTNPLFAGLGGSEEEAAEQYDEPVIVRLGVKESEELSAGFPRTAEELFGYHAVILDDVESEFFSQDQMLLLRRFVAQRGGGLMMLGGQESFRGESFAGSPLGDLSPVYAASRDRRADDQPLRFALTREGMLQPWVRLRDTEATESLRLNQIAPLRTANPIGDVKPGASVLAHSVSPDGESTPALVVQRFGNGRTVAVPLGDLWRWSMRRDPESRDDPAQLWRQWTRWLVGEVPRRTEVSVVANRDAAQPARISVIVRDEMFRPLDNADVELEIQPLGGKPVTIKATPDATRPGIYGADFWTKQTDGFRVTAKVVGSDGASLPADTSGWVSEPKAAEFQQLATNRELLERIAQQTGGRVLEDDALDDFAAELPHEKVPVSQAWVYPVWHRPWVLMLALACLCGEWGLRRWKGLA